MATKVRSSKKKKGSQNPEVDGSDLIGEWGYRRTEAPRADMEQYTGATKKERYRKWFIWACLACMPLFLLMTIGVGSRMAQMGNTIDEQKKAITALQHRPTGGAEVLQDSPGRYAAYQSLQSWLANQPSPLPGGKILYWTGSSSLTSSNPKDKRTIETFALSGGDGKGYAAKMEVAIDPRGGAKVLAGPSLESIPGEASDEWASNDMWSGVTIDHDVSEQIRGAASTWATAYFSGNPQQLGLAVGDPNGSHTYEPMSGAAKVTASVTDSASVPDRGNGAKTIARVELVPQWNNGDNSNGSGAPIIMDVLIRNANTAAPQIVAWGAPGTGPTLKPYQNALTVPLESMDQNGNSSSQPSASSNGPAPAKTQTPTETAKPSTNSTKK